MEQTIVIDLALLQAYLEQIPKGAYKDNQYSTCGQPRSSKYCPLAHALDWKYGDVWEVGFKARRRLLSGDDEVYEFGEEVKLFTHLVDSFKDHNDGMWYGDVRVWHAKRMVEQAQELMKLGEYHRVIELQKMQKQWKMF